MFTLWDGVLLGALLGGCILLWAILRAASPGSAAVVLRDGRELCRIPLAEGREKTVYTVPGEGTVRIAAEGTEAWFETSDCPDRLCVRRGRLSRTGETAVCLPAGVVLQIVGGPEEADARTG